MRSKTAFIRKMKKFVAFALSLWMCLSTIRLLSASYAAEKEPAVKNISVQADASAEAPAKSLAFGEYGEVIPGDIICQEDFEDGDLKAADTELINGMTWTSSGKLVSENLNSNKRLRMNAGAYVISDQVINQSEYTVSFTVLNFYNTSAQVAVAYQDENNYYCFHPASGKVFRFMDGVKEELTTANVSRILTSPRQTPSINAFKIYFKNDGESITLSVDRDGYINGKDYEFTYIDHNSSAVNRFKGGRIKLARVDDGVSVYWVNYDNVMVSKGKLQKVLPRELGQLYVNPGTGDDSFDGSLSKPFKTINKALESSFPGDEIILQDGVYDEKIEFKSSRMYGEEGKLLTIRPQNRHKATFVTDVNLKYGDYVRLEGFEINGKSVFIGGSTGVEVIDNYIHDVQGRAAITATGVNGRVADNYIFKCNQGIFITGTNMLAENNEIERLIWNGADCDYFRFFGDGHIIRGNYMHGTRGDEIGGSHTDGFQTFDNNGEYVRNCIIEGNFIEDFYHEGFMGSGIFNYHSYDLTFRNNVFKDSESWGLCINSLKDSHLCHIYIFSASFSHSSNHLYSQL